MALRRPPTTFSDEISAADLAANSVGASELADNAVDEAAIAANAVTTAKIADSSSTTTGITPAKIAENAVTSAKIATGAVVADGLGAGAVGSVALSSTALASVEHVKPHIQPGVLQPAVAGKLLDGTTSHSGAYGTAQSDGRSYYYTDIKGSKPIKDPRIGAHFGSQRHQATSLQLLEQETATNGTDVYSIDGREWMRAYGPCKVENNAHGVRVQIGEGSVALGYFEIVGYFSDINLQALTGAEPVDYKYKIDGGSLSATQTTFVTTNNTPLGSRYEGRGSSANVVSGQTLGLHTLTFVNDALGDYFDLYSVELIAQDLQDFTATNATNILTSTGHTLSNGDQIRLTGADLPNGLNATTSYFVVGASGNNFQVSGTSGGSAVTFSDDGTGSRTFTALNNIQIHAQNVVSYGKKFSISATAQHYNPFNGMTGANNLAALGNYIDTATSLGMENWKAGTANYYKPFNGGRVVKWVDSSGAIKTSVTMMPPNAQNYLATASNPISNAHIIDGTNDDIVNFDTTTIANATPLSEVAKTFHWREFGNGNGNGGPTGTFKDASMLDGSSRDIHFCMNDGLTSLMANDVANDVDMLPQADDDDFWVSTFIGTGVTRRAQQHAKVTQNIAQNLPYGTHVLKGYRHSSGTSCNFQINGVTVGNIADGTYGELHELTFHQPKMPPVPEDACILADYMLMANFVPEEVQNVSSTPKGTRLVSCSRDFLYAAAGTTPWPASSASHANVWYAHGGFQINADNNQSVCTWKLPFFGSGLTITGEGSTSTGATADFKNGSTQWDSGATRFGVVTGTTGTDVNWVQSTNANAMQKGGVYGEPLGVIDFTAIRTSGRFLRTYSANVITPIHTSSHYQTFETPFTHDLTGGDRNMEQTNLVVTADGKTWDQVTRDTSYIGNGRVFATRDGGTITSATTCIMDTWRGKGYSSRGDWYNKDFAIAYEKVICLVDGHYNISVNGTNSRQGGTAYFNIRINGSMWIANELGFSSGAYESANLEGDIYLKRGDTIHVWCSYFKATSMFENTLQISRL